MGQVRERDDLHASALDDVLRERLEQIADILEVDTTVVVLFGVEGHALATAGDETLADRIAAGLELPMARAETDGGRSLLISDLRATDGLDPLLRANGIQALVAVALLMDDHVVGLLAAGTLAARRFSEAEASLLQLFADRVALDVLEGGAFGEHRRAWTLQRSVLAEPLPEIPGLAIAARYLPARASAGIGGGWYDVFGLRDGRIGVAIGDVANRGGRAAQLAGKLRDALRAYAVDGDEPEVVASHMWHFVDALESGEMATLLYALYDPGPGLVRLYSAGHVGPVFVGADHAVHFPEVHPAAPLGVGGPPHVEATAALLDPGATMLLYTEGLAERPGERLESRRARVAREARLAVNDPHALCSRLINNLLGGRRPEDDVAMVAVQAAVAAADAIHRVVPAVAEELAPMRRLLRRWLTARGAGEQEVQALTLAVQEACANAIEHAYDLGDATFELDAVDDAGEVEISIRDHGHWRAPRGENRGRGLGLMHALVDDVEVHRGEDGTTVRLRRRLAAPRRRP